MSLFSVMVYVIWNSAMQVAYRGTTLIRDSAHRVREREREIHSVCVCERERERERDALALLGHGVRHLELGHAGSLHPTGVLH